MDVMGKRTVQTLVGVAISLGLLWGALASVHLGKVWDALRGADYRWAPVAVALYLFSNLVRATLWRRLLGPGEAVSTCKLFGLLMMGLMANNVLPARLGELVRAHAAGRELGVSRTRVFGTIVVERLLDVTCLVALSFAAFLIHVPQRWPQRLAALAGALLCAAALAGWLLRWKGEGVLALATALAPTKVRPRLSAELAYYRSALLEGVAALGAPGAAVAAVALSAASWLAWVGFFGVSMSMFGLRAGPLELALLTGIVNLSVMIPSAPGYVGTFQFACVQALSLFGVPAERALGFSVAFHALWYLTSTGLGAVSMARSGVSFARVRGLAGQS